MVAAIFQIPSGTIIIVTKKGVTKVCEVMATQHANMEHMYDSTYSTYIEVERSLQSIAVVMGN